MKKLFLIILCLVTVQWSFAVDGKEQEIKSKVKEAIVFLNGAQVTRGATVNIPKGRSKLKFIDITTQLNKGSVNVSSDGDFTIVSVLNQINYLEAKKDEAKIDELDKKAEEITDKIAIANEMLSVYREEESLLAATKNVKVSEKNLPVAEIRAAADFYRERLTEVKMKKFTLGKEIKGWNKELVEVAKELRELNAVQSKATSEVIVEVNANRAIKTDFKVSYLIGSAGWYPNYDIRVKNVNSPIALTYKANVFQLSGEDWTDVKLTLSSGNPYQRSTRPILQPWRISPHYQQPVAYNYQQRQSAVPSSGAAYSGTVRGYITDAGTGEALIGASVQIIGTSYGAVTDVDGFYQINVPPNTNARSIRVSYVGYTYKDVPINNSVSNIQLAESAMTLDEVTVSSYGKRGEKLSSMFKNNRDQKKKAKDDARARRPVTNPVQVQRAQKATTTEFAIALPYSIPSNGKQYAVDIKQEEVKSDYEYYAAPKLDEAAYLTARIPDWEEYDLLNGEVNLYFEGTYLGKTVLDVNSIQDTMEISLGRDKDIVIERKKQKDGNRRQLLGANQVSNRGWDINIRNKKKEDVRLVVQDQIPLSANQEVVVELKSQSKAKKTNLVENTGILTWEVEVKANSKATVSFKYEVKYPKKMTLQLE